MTFLSWFTGLAVGALAASTFLMGRRITALSDRVRLMEQGIYPSRHPSRRS